MTEVEPEGLDLRSYFSLKHYFIIAAGFTIPFYISTSYAEFSCRVEISYKWKKAEAETVAEVRISGIEAKGADENAAKAAVGQVLGREKARAYERCRAQHENVAQCVSSKYEVAATTLQNVGFSARKAIEEAITGDCKAVQGTCQEVVASDPTCVEIAQAASAEGEKDGGKDGKDAKEKDGGKDSKKK